MKLHVYVEWIVNFPPILHVVPIQTCFWVISCSSVVYWSALSCRLLLPPLFVWVEKQRKKYITLVLIFFTQKNRSHFVFVLFFQFLHNYFVMCYSFHVNITSYSSFEFHENNSSSNKNTFEIYTKTFNVKFTEIKLMCLSRILADSLENVHVKFPYGDLPYARLW